MSALPLSLGAALLSGAGIGARPVTCDVCGALSGDQVAYCLHSDHHEFQRREVLMCKRCEAAFESPCKFYGHACCDDRTGEAAAAFWCGYCEASEVCERHRSANHGRGGGGGGGGGGSDKELPAVLNDTSKGRPRPHVQHQAPQANRQTHVDAPVGQPSREVAAGSGEGDVAKAAGKPTSNKKQISNKMRTSAKPRRLRTMTTTHHVRRRRSADLASDSTLSGAFMCPDCSNKIIRDPAALARHNELTGGSHINVRPLWTYDRLSVRLVDVGLSANFREKVAKELDFLYEQDIVRRREKAQSATLDDIKDTEDRL